jgi:hypothetical protein
LRWGLLDPSLLLIVTLLVYRRTLSYELMRRQDVRSVLFQVRQHALPFLFTAMA